jgi:putative membrane protein
MNKNLWMLGLAPALALGACGGGNTDSPVTNATPDDASMMNMPADENMSDNAMGNAAMASPSQKFADAAGASDYYEVEAGKLAEDKATSQGLKDFGKMMVANHTDSTEKLKAAAAKAMPAITPNPVLNTEQEANLAALRAADGADFDAKYKAQQISAHEKALAAMKDYAASGDAPELVKFAGDTTKVVETHLAKIKAM